MAAAMNMKIMNIARPALRGAHFGGASIWKDIQRECGQYTMLFLLMKHESFFLGQFSRFNLVPK